MKLLNPNSVVDVGCGLAQWLSVFRDAGVSDILGIDGNHVPRELIYIDQDCFMTYDLEECKNFSIDRKYDLAVSLEVAEHLLPDKADGSVDMLTSLSDVILFSAAIPGQTGENHFNEQPHDYWQGKFLLKGYYMMDILRPVIWNNININWWYRQNIFLLIKKDHPLYDESNVFDGRQIVHPELLEMYINKVSSLQHTIQQMTHISNHSFSTKLINYLKAFFRK